jgi:uncharacterized caspase-like protein
MAEKRSALVVATSEYEDARLAPLAGPAQDAEALEKVLASAEIGGFDVQLALNAAHDDLRTTLEGFFSDRGRDDLLLVHFSGHGLKDDDGLLYLAAADTRIDRLMSTGVEAGFVNRLMTRCRSEKIALFLDCCFGGAFTTGLTRRAGVDTAGVKETFTGTGRFVITASDAMQYSFEGGRRVDDGAPQPSPFTGALVEGLMTGEADRNDDGFVSINELFDYLEDRVRQISPAQTPTKSAFNQVGDWVIAQSVRAPTIRILPASLQTQLKSEDALDRFAALIDLRDLIQGSDPRLADAATKALEKLTGDDSRRVAAAAARLFGEVPGGVRAADAGVVTSTPLSQSSLPEAVKDALLTPSSAEPVTPKPAPTAAAPTAPAPTAPAPTPAPAPVQPPSRSPADAAGPGVPSAASRPISPAAPIPASVAPAPAPMPAQSAAPPLAAAQSFVAPPPVQRTSSRSDALWGAPPVAARAGTPAAGTAPTGPATAAPSARPALPRWSARRAAGRAFLGAFFGLLLALVYEIGSDELNGISFAILAGLLLISGIVTLIVGAVEKVVPALRIPGGAAYAVVGHNPWIASALVGALFGIVLMAIGATMIYLVLTILGFLAAEAVVGRAGRAARQGSP